MSISSAFSRCPSATTGLLVLVLLFVGRPLGHAQSGPSPALAPVDTTVAGVNVRVDPRIELMSIVQLMTDYPVITKYESAYRRDVAAYFAPHRGPPAVQRYRKMWDDGFAFDAVPKAMLALTPPPALSSKWPHRERAVQAAGGRDSLDQFVRALRDFADATNVSAFYRAHRGTYATMLDSVTTDSVGIGAAVEPVQAYTGHSIENSTVILGPLLHHGGFGARFQIDDALHIYALLGPSGTRSGLPDFGSPRRLARFTSHEMLHSVVNPLTRRHWDQLRPLSALYEPIRPEMEEQAYGTWKTAVDEHVIRAVNTRLAHRQFGADAGDRMLQGQKEQGFRYVEPLVEALKRYERQRDQYPTLADFYPELIEVFRRLAADGPDRGESGGG